ncbi:hypothetical protein MACH24_18780 [Erythrobacter sp. Dej080120_24]|uniref:hypothetical protein n=1 Tax=Erythrobacter sp. Dej080120_24 TaxID=3024837 RepID=UPI002923BE2F|nr:hypothetical protein MACH24_18780 [Erythrobacter sp. Dej080120_24]
MAEIGRKADGKLRAAKKRFRILPQKNVWSLISLKTRFSEPEAHNSTFVFVNKAFKVSVYAEAFEIGFGTFRKNFPKLDVRIQIPNFVGGIEIAQLWRDKGDISLQAMEARGGAVVHQYAGMRLL